MLSHVEFSARDLAAEVTGEEYARLLGWPRGRALSDELASRAAAARGWYAEHGRPWAVARRLELWSIDASGVTVETGETFTSRALADRLRTGEAHGLLALAVTAGVEVDVEARRLWDADKPDEAFFLDRFGAAVAERLVFGAMLWFCRRSEPQGETLLPHLSPGCGGWMFEDQAKLMTQLTGGAATIGPLRMLPSGMLSPKNSLLSALGITARPVAASPADACRACDLTPCAFRRAPHRGAA
jgi:hypothetical protein